MCSEVDFVRFMGLGRYYTDFNYPPVRQIAQASLTGHGTNVIAGMSVGMRATAAPAAPCILTLKVSIKHQKPAKTRENRPRKAERSRFLRASSWWRCYAPIRRAWRPSVGTIAPASLGRRSPPWACAGARTHLKLDFVKKSRWKTMRINEHRLSQAVSDGLSALHWLLRATSRLSTVVFVLAMDVFGPITDNAGGIVEMSEQPESVRDITDTLDAVGNTTKAITKGFSVGSASLACFLLFSAFLDEVSELAGHKVEAVDISVPEVFLGGVAGATLVFYFSGQCMTAVGSAAQEVVNNVRQQFSRLSFKGHDGMFMHIHA